MKVVYLIAIIFAYCLAIAGACSQCEHVSRDELIGGTQHADCQYASGHTRHGPASEEQDEIDRYWVKYAHEYGMRVGPRAPFVGAIVDTRNNKLVCISVNQRPLSDSTYSWRTDSHGEVVVIQNCTQYALPDSIVDGKKVVHPDWIHMTLYGNIETCPMCAMHVIYRGIPRMVFGARASLLMAEKCWSQSTLTVQEVVDHYPYFPVDVRGPISGYEDVIIAQFPSRCPNPCPPTA